MYVGGHMLYRSFVTETADVTMANQGKAIDIWSSAALKKSG